MAKAVRILVADDRKDESTWMIRVEGCAITHKGRISADQVQLCMAMVGNAAMGESARLATPEPFDPSAWRVLATA